MERAAPSDPEAGTRPGSVPDDQTRPGATALPGALPRFRFQPYAGARRAMLVDMGLKTAPFRRLLDTRVRTVVLVVATVLFLGSAVVIGLPPQSGVPVDLGQMIVLPDLPSDGSASSRQVVLGWLALAGERQRSASMVWAISDVDLYVAVDDTSVVAEVLRQCVAKPDQGGQGPSRVSAVAGLPTSLKPLLARFDMQDFGGVRSHTYFKLAHTETPADAFPIGSCSVDPAYSLTMDAVELHFRAPQITVVMPKGLVRARGEPAARTVVRLGALPPGWSVQDQRAAFGTRQEGTDQLGWDGAQVAEQRFGRAWDVGLVGLGPVTIEASSLNEARRAERGLFWAGLLVGLAGSCLLMLFEGLPWRPAGRGNRAAR